MVIAVEYIESDLYFGQNSDLASKILLCLPIRALQLLGTCNELQQNVVVSEF